VNSQNLTEEQMMIQEMAYSFSNEKILPNAAKWDEEKHFPVDEFKEAADLGFGGIYVSEENGGCGLGRLEASLIFEALSTGCPATSAFISIHNMCAWMVDTFGNEEVQGRFLPEMLTMERLASYCLTEPNSGSDAQSMKTKAEDKGDHFLVNGSKCFISGAGTSHYYLIMCKTGENEVSCLMLEKGMEGLSFGKNEDKLGWNC
jgi:acyl-CoA dehydrogenase